MHDLVFNYKDKWYVNDYNKVHNGFATLKEAVEDYNKIYINSYCKDGSEVVYNGFIEYNHTTGKFKSVKHQLKELLIIHKPIASQLIHHIQIMRS